MTELELDRRIRTALLQANWAEYALRPGEEEPELPAGLRRRMRPLLADPFGRRRRARRAFGRCAAAAVLALSVSFGALMAVSPDARAWVQRITVQILEKYTTIRFAGESGASGQLGNWAPTWLPEGYELTQQFNTGQMVTSLYTNKAENYIDFEYTTSDYKFNLDNEHHVAESITIHGNPAHFLRAIVPGYASTLTWYDESNHTAFSLSADLPADNLIRIAESIEKI